MREQDEVAARIARQSQMERMIDYCKLTGIKPSLTDLVRSADILSRYITDGWSSKKNNNGSIEELLNKVDELLDKYSRE